MCHVHFIYTPTHRLYIGLTRDDKNLLTDELFSLFNITDAYVFRQYQFQLLYSINYVNTCDKYQYLYRPCCARIVTDYQVIDERISLYIFQDILE